MQKPENEKSEEMKITPVLLTIIMIRLTSNVSRLKMDAGKLFKESSLLRALNLVRGSAGRPKDFTNKRQCDAVMITLTSLLENHVLIFRFEQKQKSQRRFVWLFIWSLPFLGLCPGFHVFVRDFNDIFQIEDWFSLRQQMPVMTLPKVTCTENKCAIGSNVLPSLPIPSLWLCCISLQPIVLGTDQALK